MEHNHDLLKYKFFASIIMLMIGMFMGFVGAGGVDFHSKVTIYASAGIIVVVGAVILRRTFKERDACEICKERYFYGKRK